MPLLKPISGHTSCRGVFRYLTRSGHALTTNYLNLDIPEREGAAFDWAATMDDTRSRWRNEHALGAGSAAPTSTTYSRRTRKTAWSSPRSASFPSPGRASTSASMKVPSSTTTTTPGASRMTTWA